MTDIGGSGPAPYTSMEWLNNLISSWYDVNDEKVHEVVKEVLEKELNKLLPDIIEHICLQECTFGTSTPTIQGIKSRVVSSKQLIEGKQKKIVMDIILSIDSPEFEFKLGVKVPLVTITAAIQKLSFTGNLRVTALFSDQVPFPGIQNLCITFTDRPNVGFNVELLDVIDIDTFGIDNIISDLVEDILAKELVYPGRLYVDMSKLGTTGQIETIMMPRESGQHPGVITTTVNVSRIQHATDTTKVQVGIVLGKDEKRSEVELRVDNQTVSQNYLIDDFDVDELVVKAWESRLFFKDVQYGTVKVDLADMEFSLPSVTKNFTNEDKNVAISVKVNSYLLPLIALKQEKDKVTDYLAKFSGETSTVPLDINSGVMYVHVHRATGVPQTDLHSKADPYVTVYYEEKEVLKTDEVTNSDNPIFDEWCEFLIDNFIGSRITFKMDDNDVWPNSDDPIGVVSVDMTMDYIRNINTPLKLTTNRPGVTLDINLYVSFVFRPVPLV